MQNRTEQDKTGQDRIGQDRTGQEGTEECASDVYILPQDRSRGGKGSTRSGSVVNSMYSH